MTTFFALQLWFLLTAIGYSGLVAQSTDGITLKGWPFPVLERSHFTVPILKILPTVAVLLTGLFAFDYGVHWFTVSYAVFLVLMVIIDYGIVARPRQFMYLALASHILSELTCVALVVTTSLSLRALACYGGAALLVGLFTRGILEAVSGRERAFVLAYAALMWVLVGSFATLATSPASFPPALRAAFAGTAIAIGTTDCLWARWEFGRRGRKWAVIGTYYPAIWLIAIDMILFARYIQAG